MEQDNVHFSILQDIARDLSGDVNFPICLDSAIMVRNTLRDPLADIGLITRAVGLDPLISSKLLRLANSVAYCANGKPIADIGIAIQRLGIEVVRTISLAVAMDQMLNARRVAGFQRLSREVWEHSVHVAAIARVLARRLGRINPDEAMLTGLVHDLGVFYLLYRAVDYPHYRENEALTMELLRDWHEEIGETLLDMLELPPTIKQAVREHEHLNNVEGPFSLCDILYFANLLAGGDQEWMPPNLSEAQQARREAITSDYFDLLAEAAEDIVSLKSALSA